MTTDQTIPRRKRFTVAQENEIAAAYAAGLSSHQVGQRWGICPATVLKIVRRRDGTVRDLTQAAEGKPGSLAQRFGAGVSETICTNYLAGKPIPWIARAVGCSQGGVLKVLLRNGVSIRSRAEASRLRAVTEIPPEVEAEILRLNEAGERLSAIEHAVNLSRFFVVRVLRQHGRTWSGDKATHHYSLDDHFFAEINTEEKAYWLGFLCADGSVTSRDNGSRRLVLGLKGSDRSHVEAFREALRATHPIQMRMVKRSDGKRHLMAAITIHSRPMMDDLAQWGVVPGKTSRLAPPDVPAHLARHLWRGWLDGDGCLHPARSPNIILVGTLAVVTAFGDYVRFAVRQTRARPRQGDGNYYTISFAGAQLCGAIAKHLYDGAGIALARKSAKAREIMAGLDESWKPGFDWQSLDLATAECLYDELGRWSLVARRLGVHGSALCRHLQKLRHQELVVE
jgi:hypothetical protein